MEATAAQLLGDVLFSTRPGVAGLKKQLTQKLETARYMRRAALWQQVESLESHSITLTDERMAINPTATIGARLAADSVELQQLAAALQRAGKQEYYTMCPPIYRDALAFYNEADELVSVLNICFECRFMQTNQKEHVEADMATYNFLRMFLLQAGHLLEDDGWA